jgi:ACS family pantothenate transporter-like MFS transporter
MLALRFVVGLFEAGYWPALYYILGSWYNKRKAFAWVTLSKFWSLLTALLPGELGKRNGILQSAVSIAPIFSGFLQAGIYNSLNGHALDGDGFLVVSSALSLPIFWHDFIVINGVISLPIAVLAYFFLPDVPGTAKPNWLFSQRVSTNIV